jgi:N-acetylmuramic acid 6-phosphate etherase
VDAIAARLAGDGRLFYVGAGTSGRLGVLDASECPPTFSSAPDRVQGVIAGGERALREAVEGAEDDRDRGAADLHARNLGPLDYVVGISANGGAPYVQGALAAAREVGAGTALITCNPVRPELIQPDQAIVLPVGPEVLSGSTRLKAGTATKLVLNMLSTLAMVKLGKVHDNLMVDVRVSNRKLQARAERLVRRLTGLEAEPASRLLAAAGGSVKRAAVMHHAAVDGPGADALLAESRGFLRPWLENGVRSPR